MNLFSKIKASLRLRQAILLADKAHRKSGFRYFVIPVHGSHGKKLMVLDRFNFRRLKMKHYIHRLASMSDLQKECFYYTGHANGRNTISPQQRQMKIAQYFAWVEADRKATKQHRKNG